MDIIERNLRLQIIFNMMLSFNINIKSVLLPKYF